jgi:DNA (cytosine-5)-methyltransferase 1
LEKYREDVLNWFSSNDNAYKGLVIYDKSLGKEGVMKTVDLFAGVGGIRLGFERAGFKTVFSNDFEPECKKAYDLNFENSKLVVKDVNDIRSRDLPAFDILLAGFPCQPFSIAGHRKGFSDKGRGELFFKILEILKTKKPRAILLENVKNLKSHDNGRTFEIITRELHSIGYHLNTKILNSKTHGNVPQNRERIFIVGFLSENAYNKFKFPEEIKLSRTFKDLLEKDVDSKYYYNGKQLYSKLSKEVTNRNSVYQWRRKYVRENKKGVVPTLTANMGMGGHNVPIIKDDKGIRKLTPKECFMIQGFPRSFQLPPIADSKLYKQAGNSVTVTVIERIAKNIKRALA